LFPARADRVDDNPPTALVYGYDPDDNLLSMEDENDSETFMRYDALNRLIAVRVFRAGQSDTHASDSIFAPSPASDPSNSSATMVIGTTKQDYHYDGLSRLVRATDNNDPSDTRDDSTVTFTYDGLSRIVEELQQIDTVTRTVSSAWRAGDLRSRVTYPNNREVFYTYDALDRIKMISEVPEAITYTVYLPLVLRAAAPPRLNVPETFVRAAASVTPTTLVTFTYIGTGRVLERAYANGVTLTYLDNAGTNDVGYDGAQRVTQLHHVRADVSLVVGFTQTYSRMDDKLTETKLHNTANNEVYAYDSQNRLMQFNRPHVGAVTPLHSNWKLDGVGGWQQVRSTESGTPITETRTHSSHNEIITRTGGVTATILSDDSGNETDDGTYLFQWDFDNRLRSVTRKSDSQLIATYQYDALGRRIRKTVTNTASLNGTTDFVFDGWQIIEERDGNNQLRRQTIYGLLLDEPLILDRNLGGGTTATGANDQRLYYHHNTVGSVFGLSNQTGKLVEAYQYDAYGRVVVYAAGANGAIDFGGDDGVSVGGASGVGNAYLFTGQRLDAETNLYHYKRRYYSPTQGRFISRDPIEFFSARSVYEYAVSNPATFVDPWGLTEYKMQAPTKVPWSNHKLKKGTHGLTVPTELSVSCRCVCCEDMKRSNNWKVECTLTLNILILMDEDQINAANKKHGGWNTTSVYGHEQKHVKAIQDAVKARVDAIDTGGCDFTKTMCPKKAKDFEKKILEAAQKGLNDGAGHDAHGHDGKPADGTPYAPDKGTDVPGLKGNEQPPKMPPKELEDFWRKAQIGGNIPTD
jgi:RHS repeat-associated protein